MNKLCFNLHQAGVLAPGIASLDELKDVCCKQRSVGACSVLQLPTPLRLPANERRRASQVVKLTLACIEQVSGSDFFPVGTLRSVFATDDGIGEVSQKMLDVLSTTRQVSPLVFPNSVHGAAAGYFSIAFQNRQPATTVSLGVESFAAGLLCAVTDAIVLNKPVLFVSYDGVMSAPIDEVLPISSPTATAWLITSGANSRKAPVLGQFELSLETAPGIAPSEFPHWLPAQWASNSSAQGFAALSLLESGPGSSYRFALGDQTVLLEFSDRPGL